MLSLSPSELTFAIFLVALIAVAPWIPRVGELLGSLFASQGRGTEKSR
jgi:hypothetical protein